MSTTEYLLHYLMTQDTVLITVPTGFDQAFIGFVSIIGVVVLIVAVVDLVRKKEPSNAKQ